MRLLSVVLILLIVSPLYCADPSKPNVFKPLLDDPKQTWKTAAFSQYPRGGGKDIGQLMGYAVRTERYRYVEWRKRNGTEVVARELYDHQNDPNEDVNIAANPQNANVIERHAKILSDGWAKNAPPVK